MISVVENGSTKRTLELIEARINQCTTIGQRQKAIGNAKARRHKPTVALPLSILIVNRRIYSPPFPHPCVQAFCYFIRID